MIWCLRAAIPSPIRFHLLVSSARLASNDNRPAPKPTTAHSIYCTGSIVMEISSTCICKHTRYRCLQVWKSLVNYSRIRTLEHQGGNPGWRDFTLKLLCTFSAVDKCQQASCVNVMWLLLPVLSFMFSSLKDLSSLNHYSCQHRVELILKQPYWSSCLFKARKHVQTASDHLQIDFYVGEMSIAKIKIEMNLDISSRAGFPYPPKCFINYEGSWCSLRYSMHWGSKSKRRQLSHRPTTHCSHYLKPWRLTTPKQ